MSGWRRFRRSGVRRILVPRRGFDREAKLESRVFCPCELCRLRFNRMLYARSRSGEPLGYGRLKRLLRELREIRWLLRLMISDFVGT